MRKAKIVIAQLRLTMIFPWICWSDEKLIMDIHRCMRIRDLSCSDRVALALLMWDLPEFRNLFIYRNRFRVFYRAWIALWYKPLDTLFIEAKEIGGGLFIQHGFSTMISAEYIGENCWINQQVTIGFNGHGRAPVIGNNVMITCGAKVLGPITVGDNAVIGANAVVIRDVESGTVMGGVPARRLK